VAHALRGRGRTRLAVALSWRPGSELWHAYDIGAFSGFCDAARRASISKFAEQALDEFRNFREVGSTFSGAAIWKAGGDRSWIEEGSTLVLENLMSTLEFVD
jgi:hypothetical protein